MESSFCITHIDILFSYAIIYLTGQPDGDCDSPFRRKIHLSYLKITVPNFCRAGTVIFYACMSKSLLQVTQTSELSAFLHKYS